MAGRRTRCTRLTGQKTKIPQFIKGVQTRRLAVLVLYCETNYSVSFAPVNARKSVTMMPAVAPQMK